MALAELRSGRRPAAGRGAFTLVELLVVIGIIAVLVGILLPTISKARDSARKAACAANLHNWGVACFSFAAERHGVFPVLWKHANGPYFPSMLDYDDYYQQHSTAWPASAKGPDAWMTWGTTLEVFARFGVLKGNVPPAAGLSAIGVGFPVATADLKGNLVCPSSPYPLVRYSYIDTLWGDALWGNYMYVGGLTLANANANGTTSWGLVAPAVRQSDKYNYNRVLAADEVFFTNFTPRIGLGTSPVRINHARRDDPTKVDFQNILYGDGHVQGYGREYYPNKIDGTNSSLVSLQGWFYWSGTTGGQPSIQ